MSGRSRASGARSSVSSHPPRDEEGERTNNSPPPTSLQLGRLSTGSHVCGAVAGSARAVASSAGRACGTTCGRPRRALADRARASRIRSRSPSAIPCRQNHRSRLGGRKPRPRPRSCGRFCAQRSPSANTCRQSHQSGLGGRKPWPGPAVAEVLQRSRSPSAVPPAAVDASPAPTAERIPLELHPETRQVGESAGSPAGEPRSRRRPIDETEPTPTHPSPPVAGQPERSPRPTEVVEFEAPAQRLAARAEREASPDRQIRAGVPRQSAENALRAELAVDEIGIERAWERAVPPPAPRRESNVERLREPAPAAPRPTSQRESSA